MLYEWGGKNKAGKDEFAPQRPSWPMSIHDLLKKHKVSAVFHGHDHSYARQELDDIVYQLVPEPVHPGAERVKNAKDYGYLRGQTVPHSGIVRVTVTPNTATVDYVQTYLPSSETATPKKWRRRLLLSTSLETLEAEAIPKAETRKGSGELPRPLPYCLPQKKVYALNCWSLLGLIFLSLAMFSVGLLFGQTEGRRAQSSFEVPMQLTIPIGVRPINSSISSRALFQVRVYHRSKQQSPMADQPIERIRQRLNAIVAAKG